MFPYRVGLPLWKLAARVGFPIYVRVEVLWDEVAQVYVATSPDVTGLVVEAKDFNILDQEISDGLNMLLDGDLPKPKHNLEPVYKMHHA